MDDETIAALLGIPWDRLLPRHKNAAREFLAAVPVGRREKEAQFLLQLWAFQSRGDYDRGMIQILTRRANTLLRDLAAAGDLESQVDLAGRLLEGEGIKKDQVEAVQWLERALVHGYAPAARMLSLVYEYHRGAIRRDLEASRRYHELADQMEATQDGLD